jgi:hypothetical protein
VRLPPADCAGPAILLPMPQDPLEEWRRLTALYSEMGDIEIQDLADQINNLTPSAQQVLQDELKKRGISADSSVELPTAPGLLDRQASVNWEPATYRYRSSESQDESHRPYDYTWKVPLCDCETTIEARRVAEMLRRAGIDSWIEAPEVRGTGAPRILVGADQVDHAQVVAAQPIPQDILDHEKEIEEAAAYELPTCPKCKAADPILESVEPSNNWLCESCGHAWSEPLG